MSAYRDLREDLEMIHDMMPLSDREVMLAQRVIFGDGEADIETEIARDADWWGPKAVSIVEHFVDQYCGD